jgi:hypothetical protein
MPVGNNSHARPREPSQTDAIGLQEFEKRVTAGAGSLVTN